MPRIVILTEGKSTPYEAKTATGILRYRLRDVAAILDSTRAGRKAGEVLGVGGDVPFIARLAEARDADTLLIGIAPAGGDLPQSWRALVREAIERGMSIVSGLHFFVGDDPEFRELAARRGVEIHDLRKPAASITVAKDQARRLRTHRVHTVGHDCSVGKMVASLEITRALRERGRRAEFVATGQTGILIAGRGVPVDHVLSDFVAGAIEAEILAHQEEEFLVVEGQGSLVHPLYSGVTLSLLHGCAPQTMVMVFDPTRATVRNTDLPMPPLAQLIRIYEDIASLLTPSRVVAVAANTYALGADEAERAVKETEDELGIPTADVIRHGPERLAEAVLAHHRELGLAGGGAGEAPAPPGGEGARR
jgi:uncharacterized NAD-dependent epimerase/dehydratase family protein